MRRRIIPLIALVFAVSMAGCAGSTPSQAFGKPDIDQINKMIRDFTAAYNAKDVEKIGACFSANASIMPANRSTLRGIDGVKGYYKERFTVDGATNLAVEMLGIEGQGSLAYFAGTFRLALRPPDGSPERRDHGKVIWILRKLGGQWKFEWQIMSSDLPPAAPPAPAPPVK